MLIVFQSISRTYHENNGKQMPLQFKQCGGAFIEGISEQHIDTNNCNQYNTQPGNYFPCGLY